MLFFPDYLFNVAYKLLLNIVIYKIDFMLML
ncbi:uncharacterized protein METZ01_LOCUS479800, partial [marine metagenome]